MSRTATVSSGSGSRKRAVRKPLLSPEKGNELLGLSLLTVAVLLLLGLVSHYPDDPSLLHQMGGGASPPSTSNWIGRVGAQLSAIGFGLMGITAFGLPLLLGAVGWRRMTGRKASHPLGRGFGALLLLVTLPALLQLTLGELPWRGAGLDAGGVLGRLLGEGLEARFNLPGALLLLLAGVVIGSTLLVQSTLGELLARLGGRLQRLTESLALARSRRREQRQKRNTKHEVSGRLARLRRKVRQENPTTGAEPPLDLPLRVVEKRGAGSFSIRRVRASEAPHDPALAYDPAPEEAAARPGARPAASAPSAPPPSGATLRPVSVRDEPPKLPQQELPFSTGARRGQLPPVNLLDMSAGGRRVDPDELVRLGELIRQRCAEFGVEGTIEGISPGPVITIFEFQPAPGVKVSQIVNLQDDLALSLKAESVRIDRLAGRSTLGIEVPNKERQLIRLGSLLDQKGFRKAPSPLTITLGVTIHGEPYYADLATMPHLLVAGATGAGKSVGLQSMITSVVFKAPPEQVQFIFIDPKRIELGVYADIPHLGTPVVVEPQQAANVLGHMVLEMEGRYKKLAKVHVRSIAHYNHAIRDPQMRKRLALDDDEREGEEELAPLPYIVIIIDELADLMMVASSEVETAIARLAQMARAVGIHLIVATQRPSVDVLTGTIKANFPCRISYATATRHDSRTILDQVGAERLLGKGDMLFMPPGTSRVVRLHGSYVSEQETAGLVRWLKKQGKPDYDMDLLKPLDGGRGRGGGGGGGAEDDELYEEAARMVVKEGSASASFLQRRMRIGFARASRLIDLMEQDGLLGPPQGSKPRDVLVPADYFTEIDEHQ